MKVVAELTAENPAPSDDIAKTNERAEEAASASPESEARPMTAEAEQVAATAAGEEPSAASSEKPVAAAEADSPPVIAREAGPAATASSSAGEGSMELAAEQGPADALHVAPLVALSPDDADPLARALAALDRRDYATAKRLFTELGRKDAAEAIDRALAALDRKDFATAQGLFEALAPPKLAPLSEPAAPAHVVPSEMKPAPSAADAAPPVEPGDRSPPPGALAKRRRSRLPLAAAVALVALLGAGFYLFQRSGTPGASGPALAVDLVKAMVKPALGGGAEPSQARDIEARLSDVAARLDRIERDAAERLGRTGADPNAAAGLADLQTRLDALEKKVAAPADASASSAGSLTAIEARLDKLEQYAAAPVAAGTASASPGDIAAIDARLDTLEKKAAAPAPASDTAALASRLDRLEKKTAAASAQAKMQPPAAPKRTTLAERDAPPLDRETRRARAHDSFLPDYAVEDVQGGVATIDGRYGQLQVAPGDFIPGAGRVLGIERRGGGWWVLTSNGVIAGGAPPY